MTTDLQTIADKVAAFNQGMSGQAPEQLLARFGAEQADLDAAGVPSSVPAVVLIDREGVIRWIDVRRVWIA